MEVNFVRYGHFDIIVPATINAGGRQPAGGYLIPDIMSVLYGGDPEVPWRHLRRRDAERVVDRVLAPAAPAHQPSGGFEIGNGASGAPVGNPDLFRQGLAAWVALAGLAVEVQRERHRGL